LPTRGIRTVIGWSLESGSYPLSERRRKLKIRRRNLMRELRVMRAMWEMRRSKIPRHPTIFPMFRHTSTPPISTFHTL